MGYKGTESPSGTPPTRRKSSVQWTLPVQGTSDRNASVGSVQSDVGKSSAIAAMELASSEITNRHEGIYWPSPIAMVMFFLFGLLASCTHHIYYHSLAGKQVGNDSEQQWALRFFSFSFFPRQ
jgi:hypothetical protein